ncbi:MAG: hypothetical protein IJL25_12235, partial [Clostridia bacterium]|nr:hypothetical protein [Clostridia bacterium]
SEPNAVRQIKEIRSKVLDEINNDITKPSSFRPPICVYVSGKLSRDTLIEERSSWYDTKWRDVEELTVTDCKITVVDRNYV